MKPFVLIIVALLAVPVIAAGKSKQNNKSNDFTCPNGVESITKLAMMNPYDNKGKCFQYIGTAVHLVNRNKAMFSYISDDKPAAIIDFGEQSAPVTFWGGVVKGRGAYVYETISGSQNIIHSLVAIPKDKAKEITDKIKSEKDNENNTR